MRKGKCSITPPKSFSAKLFHSFPGNPGHPQTWNPWTTINFDNLSQPGKGARPTSNANDKSFDDDDDDDDGDDDDDDDIILNSTQM